MTAAERAECAALSRLLAATRVLQTLALGALALAAALLLIVASAPSPAGTLGLAAAALVLVLGLAERWLALRLVFDQGLFADLASVTIVDLPALDRALLTLGLRAGTAGQRDLDDRIAGTLRLVRLHAACVGVQTLAAAIALAAGVFARAA